MRTLTVLLTALFVPVCGGTQVIAQSDDATTTIAIVQDGGGPESAIVEWIERELPEHIARDRSVAVKRDSAFDAGWDEERVPRVLQAALDDPEVDIVLIVGSMLTQHAARPDVLLSKPVVSTFVQRADISRLPYSEEDGSLKDNLVFTAIPQRAGRDISKFQELVGFNTLHVLASAEDLDQMTQLRTGLEGYERELGITIEVVRVTPDVASALSRLGVDVEAVYVTRLQRLSVTARRELIGGLNARGIPSFSLLGHQDVELGVMAGLTPDIGEQVVRRAAINIARLVEGDPVGDLPVLLSVDTRLLINAETARAVGYRPSTEARLFAEFLHPEALGDASNAIGFDEALEIAEGGNTSLTVKDSEVESIRQDQYRARSTLLPQLTLDLEYIKADAEFVNPMIPEGSATAGTGTLTLRQLIYDDSAWSRYRASEERFKGSEWEREAERLDVLSDAGSAYLRLGLSVSLQRIQVDNLRLSEDNLELARLRRDVGYSGREEILRWESAVAEGRSDVFRSEENVEAARIAFNQILGVDQSKRWNLEETEIDPEVFSLLGGRLDPIVDDYSALRRLRDILVGIALDNDPELQAIDRIIAAEDIQLAELKRRYFLPVFFADLSYSDRFSRSGNSFLIPEENFYSIFIGASYPIYIGGRRSHDVAKSTTDLEGLERQKQFIEEIVERRTRTSLRRSENSFPRIKFSRQSAAAARDGLDLVTDQYSEGIVNITDLLEAQNQSFASEQLAAAATHQFLLDLVELQRALSWFEEDKTPEEQDLFVQRILSAVAERPDNPVDSTQ